MSKTVKIELNSDGVRALLRSPEMQQVLQDRANDIKGRCGDGYDAYVAQTRAVARVETTSIEAYRDNSINNTLLKSLSGEERTGKVVKSYKRRLANGKIITVRSYQKRK